MVDVPVISPFTHKGRVVLVGETICVSPVEAAALSRGGYVSLLERPKPKAKPVVETRALAAEAETPTTTRRSRGSDRPKRQYRRRDLKAEA